VPPPFQNPGSAPVRLVRVVRDIAFRKFCNSENVIWMFKECSAMAVRFRSLLIHDRNNTRCHSRSLLMALFDNKHNVFILYILYKIT